jgi:hypothetical protein
MRGRTSAGRRGKVLRLSWSQWLALAVVVWITVGLVSLLTGPLQGGRPGWAVALTLVLLGSAALLAVRSLTYTELAPDRVVAQRMFSHVDIDWRDTASVDCARGALSRHVVVTTSAGATHRLPAPVDGFLRWDRTFEDKMTLIGKWSLAHRARVSG